MKRNKNKLPKGPYKPQKTEEEILGFWDEHEFFKPEYHPDKGVQSVDNLQEDEREAFCIINPPPNANGRPHIGHMSGYAYQDLMARHARLMGKKVAMLPGKDHAGIQTEIVFERDVLKPKGKTKFDLGREPFYKAAYEFTQKASRWAREDEKRIGLSSDFERDTFTLDPEIVNIVLNTFIKMVGDGMIYKGVRIINWCPSCKTALADVDTERRDRQSKLYYIHYPIVSRGKTSTNKSSDEKYPRVWRLSFYDKDVIKSIKDGKKTVETRALNPDEPDRYFGDIKDGDYIVIVDKKNHEDSLLKVARNVRKYKGLAGLFKKEDLNLIFPGKKFNSIDDLKESWDSLSSGYSKKIDEFGIVVFDLDDVNFDFDAKIDIVFAMTDEEMVHVYTPLLRDLGIEIEKPNKHPYIDTDFKKDKEKIDTGIKEISKGVKDKFIISVNERMKIPYLGDTWMKDINQENLKSGKEKANALLEIMKNANEDERCIFLETDIVVAYNGEIVFEKTNSIAGVLSNKFSKESELDDGKWLKKMFLIKDFEKSLINLSKEERRSLVSDNIKGLFDTLFAYKNRVITVATTRPETMLGDTAVVVNPKDPRYKFLNLDKDAVLLPVANRVIPLITSPRIEIDFGTGALKLTPAHAPDDYTIMQEWNSDNSDKAVDYLNVIYKDSRMHGPVGKYFGMDAGNVRKDIVVELEKLSLVEKVEDLEQTVAVCERCKSVIEPLMSSQWYVDVDKLKEPAIDAVKSGKIKIHPQYMEKKYLHWMENLREWPISRSLWWGYRFPVWYKGAKTEWVDNDGKVREKIGDYEVKSEDNLRELIKKGYIYVGLEKPEGDDWVQDEDVFDTWFSSGQWAYAPLIKYGLQDVFYPTSVMETMYDILELWVSRMIMLGIYHEEDIPFNDVYLHGMVLAPDGQKMSKSKGNQITPDEIINEYGADALRLFYFTRGKAGGQYAVDYDNLLGNKKFLNKIWNSAKFVIMNLTSLEEGLELSQDRESIVLTETDKEMLDLVANLSNDTKRRMESFNFQVASSALYESYWHTFCDKYLEDVKKRLYTKDREGNLIDYDKDLRASAQWMIYHLLDTYLKLLHPFIPFITEKVWHMLGDVIEEDRTDKSIVWAGYNY